MSHYNTPSFTNPRPQNQRHQKPRVVGFDPDKCVKCHACIGVCPIKFCNIATPEGVDLDPDLCIACGECLRECRHGARFPVDDLEAFLSGLARGEKWVVLAAPAIAANFPGEFLRLNGWLKSLGVDAVFDVSFGAEVTVKSYLEAIADKRLPTVIAQPCPAIVNYIELYRPELIPYLAPTESPMGHMAKIVREFYPQYAEHRIAVLSPCVAKKQEYAATGIAECNVTMRHIAEYLKENAISLRSFAEVDYDNPPAERGVGFSTPGGLLRTAVRWNPDIAHSARKIEGPHLVYKYLDQLRDSIRKGQAPLLIDCLNCEMGCNGGPGTNTWDKSPDEIEHAIEHRIRATQAALDPDQRSDEAIQSALLPIIEQFWRKGLFDREYVNRSEITKRRSPSAQEQQNIAQQLRKTIPTDFKHCHSCGYHDCHMMIEAIHNGLNYPDNCHFYREIRIKDIQGAIAANFSGLYQELNKSSKEVTALNQIVKTIQKITQLSGILAINGAIEAARTGEAGKGFGVVATEMRLLADQTKGCAENIESQIQKILAAFDHLEETIDAAAKRLSDHSQD